MKLQPRAALFAVVLAGVAAALIVGLGLIPVKASSGHWAATEWFLHFVMKRSVATHSLGIEVPNLTSNRLVLIGAGHYEGGCRFCHGAPGHRPPVVPRHATPAPPELWRAESRFDDAELFYVVRHGIKFTAMPAWPAPSRDDEVWAVVAFLRALPELSPQAYDALVWGAPRLDRTSATHASAPAVVLERCARCHGVHGEGRGLGAFPRLARQKQSYIEASLVAFASGRRPSGIMQPIAATLTARQRSDAADWYARQRLDSPSVPGASGHERGRSIARAGIPDRRIPPCSGCHGPAPHPLNDSYPLLEGQPVAYLRQQLELFADGTRGGTQYADLMRNTAIHALTEAELSAVARYYAGSGHD